MFNDRPIILRHNRMLPRLLEAADGSFLLAFACYLMKNDSLDRGVARAMIHTLVETAISKACLLSGLTGSDDGSLKNTFTAIEHYIKTCYDLGLSKLAAKVVRKVLRAGPKLPNTILYAYTKEIMIPLVFLCRDQILLSHERDAGPVTLRRFREAAVKMQLEALASSDSWGHLTGPDISRLFDLALMDTEHDELYTKCVQEPYVTPVFADVSTGSSQRWNRRRSARPSSRQWSWTLNVSWRKVQPFRLARRLMPSVIGLQYGMPAWSPCTTCRPSSTRCAGTATPPSSPSSRGAPWQTPNS